MLKVALRNLSHPQRPRGRLFFLGPPGVGKTECARLLARYVHGHEDAILRLDMSEYQEASSVSTLIGSDKGLVGSEEGGRLTEPVRLNPHQVALLDEFEKAHPNVYNLFLQILDNGEIHDKRGHRISFRHAIGVLTSNAGIAPGTDLRHATRAQTVAALSRVFRPEFLNRIETFTVFEALDAGARRRVLQLQLERFAHQVQAEQALTLSWSEAVLDLAGEPPEGEVGARHVLRWIETELKPVVADALPAAQGSAERRVHLDVSSEGIMEASVPTSGVGVVA
jgi:ATP-dependent Clp protease ATP-binding subunit ClpA